MYASIDMFDKDLDGFITRNKCIAIDILVIYKIFLPCSPKGEFSWG